MLAEWAPPTHIARGNILNAQDWTIDGSLGGGFIVFNFHPVGLGFSGVFDAENLTVINDGVVAMYSGATLQIRIEAHVDNGVIGVEGTAIFKPGTSLVLDNGGLMASGNIAASELNLAASEFASVS